MKNVSLTLETNKSKVELLCERFKTVSMVIGNSKTGYFWGKEKIRELLNEMDQVEEGEEKYNGLWIRLGVQPINGGQRENGEVSYYPSVELIVTPVNATDEEILEEGASYTTLPNTSTDPKLPTGPPFS